MGWGKARMVCCFAVALPVVAWEYYCIMHLEEEKSDQHSAESSLLAMYMTICAIVVSECSTLCSSIVALDISFCAT